MSSVFFQIMKNYAVWIAETFLYDAFVNKTKSKNIKNMTEKIGYTVYGYIKSKQDLRQDYKN